MSLSPISSLTISSTSLFNELADATNASAASSTAATTATQASSTGSATGTSATGSSATDKLANDLAALLKSLASNNVSASQAALTKVEADLKADNSSNSSTSSTSSPSTSSTSGTSSTGSTSGSQSSNPLNQLLNQLGTALNSGDTGTALQDLTNYLLNNGQSTGSAVNVSA